MKHRMNQGLDIFSLSAVRRTLGIVI